MDCEAAVISGQSGSHGFCRRVELRAARLENNYRFALSGLGAGRRIDDS
jgi:hypothetical protein